MTDEARQYPSPEEFQDPLENFEPKTYNDPVERALAEEPVTAMQHEPFATITPDTSVSDAVEKLAGYHIACLLVVEDQKLVGVFSERDVLDKVALNFSAVKDQPVSSVMTSNPVFVYETDPSAAAVTVTAVSGYRHVPILNLDDEVVGIASPQRIVGFLRKAFGAE